MIPEKVSSGIRLSSNDDLDRVTEILSNWQAGGTISKIEIEILTNYIKNQNEELRVLKGNNKKFDQVTKITPIVLQIIRFFL